MLLLDRKANQKILINGGDIQIIVKRIDGKQVSIGIVAPRSISIDREELFVKKQQKRSYLKNFA